MLASVLLLFKFIADIIKRLFRESFYRSLFLVMMLILFSGTLFFWLAEGRSFIQAFAYSAATMALNSPYGIDWGPTSYGGVIFNLIYMFLGAGIFLLFVLETGKTMLSTFEAFLEKRKKKENKKAN